MRYGTIDFVPRGMKKERLTIKKLLINFLKLTLATTVVFFVLMAIHSIG